MNDSVQIVPAILATTEEEYKEKLAKIESCPDFAGGWVQIDLMDNKFVQNKSIGLEVLSKYPTKLKREAHLMVVDPREWARGLVKMGFDRLIFHLEAGRALEILETIKDGGMGVGIALSPQTPLDKVGPFLDKIDVLLLMSVDPGFSGQHFLPEILEKIKGATELKVQNNFLIEVDGGINEQVAKSVIEAGADILVVGSHLIEGNITENLERLWEAIHG